MHVHSLEFHRLAVHQKYPVLRPVVARPVGDLETAEPDIEPCVLAVHAHQESVEFRSLRSPLPCTRHLPPELASA